MDNTPGRYRIQAVSEMTGVPAPTLRAWERRYGVPAPRRTASAYRLYADGDVAQVLRLRDLIEQGVAPSEAATLVRVQAPPAQAEEAEDVYALAGRRLLEAVEAYDERGVEEAVDRALALGSAWEVYARVLRPAMRTVGARWCAGRLSVAQEHLASQVVGRTLRNLLRWVQPEVEGRRLLLACFPEETHDLAVYGVALRFAQWQFRTVVLGARLPPESLGVAVDGLRPAAVGLSVTVPPPEAEARRIVAAYAKAVGDVPWMVGGAAAGHLARHVTRHGGLVAGEDLEVLKAELEARIAARRS